MRNLVYKISFLVLLLSMGCAADQNKDKNAANEREDGVSDDVDASSQNMKLSPVDYVAWVEDQKNGLKVEKQIDEFTYSFQYKPLEVVALMDLKKDAVSAVELKNKMDEYKDLQYYTFRISADSQTELLKKNVKDENDYYGRIQYFSFDMQRDLKLIDGTDTLDCVLFHFERVFGLAPYATFNLGFQCSKGNGDRTLFYDEKVFGAGKLYLKIKSKNIKRLPSVITQ